MRTIKILLLGMVISLVSCEEFLDVNTDPNSPTTPDISQLLPSIMYDVAEDFSLSYNRLGYVASVYTHQLTSREDVDAYGVTGSYYAIQTFWQDLYFGPVMDIKTLIDLAEETDNSIYAGVAKVMKAYTYHMMVDFWGDIPYSEASDISNLHPAFDNDESIYVSLFELVDEAIADLNDAESANILTPGTDDLIYGGDAGLWIKAANTLKLKMYNQVRLTNMFDAAAVNALLADTESLIGPGEDLMVPFGVTNAPENRHPAFVSEYVGAQISNYISIWFYEILSGQNPNIFTGVTDPRMPYYWVRQMVDGQAAENSPEYRDGNFHSIYFGSIGTNSDHAGRASFTMMGLYPCGGKFDDGTGGGPLGQADGTGAAPQRLITYADRLFIEAELMQAGLVSGDAAAKLEEAMAASFALVDQVTEIVGPAQVITPFSEADTDETYIAAIMAEYGAAGAEKQMEILMTQKWIQGFGNGCDRYTDYRRTGYPVMFDPSSNGGYQSGGDSGSGPVPTQLTRGYPLSMPYDDDELTLNTNSPAQKILTESRVFWDVD